MNIRKWQTTCFIIYVIAIFVVQLLLIRMDGEIANGTIEYTDIDQCRLYAIEVVQVTQRGPSHLFQLNQHAIAVFRMQKHDRFVVRADLRLVAQCAHAPRPHLCNCLIDVFHLETNVVHAATFVLVEKRLNWTLVAQRMQELNMHC